MNGLTSLSPDQSIPLSERLKWLSARLQRLTSWIVIGSLLGILLFVLVQMAANPNNEQAVAFLFRTYPGLVVALASGFFGATFSMLLQTQRRTAEAPLDDVNSASAWRTLMVRSSVGLGGAVILYFFFRSGLLEGSLWPDLSRLGYDPLVNRGPSAIVPNQHWCLLVIWCFLGGFSETLVPNILTRTEKKATPA
jgi:uncharacterized integral membrane protein